MRPKRDWEELVRTKLAGLAIESREKREVIEELRAHLEESYEVFCKEGLPETEAVHRTFEQVADWRDLQRRIFIAKRSGQPMQKRVHQLWIPGFLTMTLSTVSLMTLQKLGFNARMGSWRDSDILFYVPWLLSRAFCGAFGAYISSRAGGSRGTVLLASVFPVLALTAAFLLMFPIDLVIEPIFNRPVDFSIVATAILTDGIGCILIPAAAIFVGTVLVHILISRRPSSREAAIG